MISPLGLGTARMAGLGWIEEKTPQLTPEVKRDTIRQIQVAIDFGVTFFDTADNYGQGLSESILGEALRGRRKEVIVATKFGEDPMPDQEIPRYLEEKLVKQKCEASLRRLGVECLDLYLLHRRDYPHGQVPEMLGILENLVQVGKIRYYGWSTDDVKRARCFARGEHCTAVEHRLNIFNDNQAMLDLCQEQELASLNRVPLLMGVLTGRWSAETKLEKGDPRAEWFEHKEFRDMLTVAQEIEPYLTCDGRSYVHGALGWIWARSPLTIPIPGFRNIEQIQTLVQAQQYGSLPPCAMQAIGERMRSAGIYKNT